MSKEKDFIPKKKKWFHKYGHYSDLEKIISSNLFYPVYITGLSGNGKTVMVLQACANAGRECIRVNLTEETDETDLFGGWRLVDGNMKWFNGPVIVAMQRGAILFWMK